MTVPTTVSPSRLGMLSLSPPSIFPAFFFLEICTNNYCCKHIYASFQKRKKSQTQQQHEFGL